MDNKHIYSEKELLLRVAEGDSLAFEQLFIDMYPALCYLSCKLGASPDAARDITADIFLQIWEGKNRLVNVQNVRAYLYGAVRNRCLNYLKRAQLEQVHQEKAAKERQEQLTIPTLKAIYDTEILRSLRAAIATLPPECRQVVELGLEGLGTNDIAEKLQISASAVSNQKSRAIKLLRKKVPMDLLFAILFP